jgi:DNA polymerase III epsilon subunit
MAREIVLDTETTGLDPGAGHRVIELACLEVEDLLPTGRSFHRYIDPERDIDPEAEKVHGISRAQLRGKPRFADPEIGEAFLEFCGDAPLVAHNAAFDRGFINAELARLGRPPLAATRWVCTYELAKTRFPGMYNSLDALCKRAGAGPDPARRRPSSRPSDPRSAGLWTSAAAAPPPLDAERARRPCGLCGQDPRGEGALGRFRPQ